MNQVVPFVPAMPDASRVKVTHIALHEGQSILLEWVDAAGEQKSRRFTGMSALRIERLLRSATTFGETERHAAILGLILGLTLESGSGLMLAGAGKQHKSRRRPEQAIQKNIVDTLRLILPRDTFLFAVPNGGARSKLEAAIFNGQGVVAGVTDLVLFWAGRAFGMEVKADKGALTARQSAAHEAIRRAGIPVAVVRSLPEAIAFLREQKIPLRIKGDLA